MRPQTWSVFLNQHKSDLTYTSTTQVGHTGVFDAAVEAITATDKAVGTIFDGARKHGYVLLITADHGTRSRCATP